MELRKIDLEKLQDYAFTIDQLAMSPVASSSWDKYINLKCLINRSIVPKVQAIPIPEGASNGDIIKAMFPEYEETRMCGDVRYGSKEYVNLEFVVNEDWWDAPYKRGNENGI